MKFFHSILNQLRKSGIARRKDYNREVLLTQGREQFKTLIRKGLSVPVTLL